MSMALEMKNTLAILSFLAIGLLVYPMITGVHWDDLKIDSANSGSAADATTPLDWRTLIDK